LCPVPLHCTYLSANLGGESEKRLATVAFQNPTTEGVSLRQGSRVASATLFFIIPFFLEKIKCEDARWDLQIASRPGGEGRKNTRQKF
jgi:hypothetical protein